MVQSHIIRSLYTYLNVPALTIQQESFLTNFMRVKNVTAAARMVGCTVAKARGWINEENGTMAKIIEHLADQEAYDFDVTVGMLNDMLMQAWTNASDATEQTGVVRELGKLNGLYPDSKKNTFNQQILVGQGSGQDGQPAAQVQFKQMKQIQSMSDEQLASLAGNRYAESMVKQEKSDDEGEEYIYDKSLDMHVPLSEAGEL